VKSVDIKYINDKYKMERGNYSRLLDITCSKCNTHLFFYQKDGPGPLKREYLDRIIANHKFKGTKGLYCSNCKDVLGIWINYTRENRPAFRLFQDSVKKR
jgi:RNase P subunit RPR2